MLLNSKRDFEFKASENRARHGAHTPSQQKESTEGVRAAFVSEEEGADVQQASDWDALEHTHLGWPAE